MRELPEIPMDLGAQLSELAIQGVVLGVAMGSVVAVPFLIVAIAKAKNKDDSLSKVVKGLMSSAKHPDTTTLTGKHSHSCWSVGLSMFASYMGAWVITGPVEVGYETGSWGVLLYTVACVLPLLSFCLLGPWIREISQLHGFSLIDFTAVQFGKKVEGLLSLLGFMILFFANIGDFTAMSGIVMEMDSGISSGWIIADCVVLASCCTVYSLIGGFSASIYTDFVQAVIIGVLTIVLAATLIPMQSEASDASLSDASSWNASGVCAGLVLNISCILVTYADNTFWQKFYAAKDDKTYYKATIICSLCYIPVIALFGYFGIVARALVDDGVIKEALWHGNSVFTLIQHYGSVSLSYVILFMSTLCVMSSVDNRILALGNLLGQHAVKRGLSLNYTRLFGLLVAIAAVVISVYQPASIMQILYCGNLLGCISAPILLLSIWKWTTTAGIWCGAVTTVLTICTFGWVYMGNFKGGFDWWLFPLGYYEWSCFYTYLAAIAVAFGVNMGVSVIDRKFIRKQPFKDLKLKDEAKGGKDHSDSSSLEEAIAHPEVYEYYYSDNDIAHPEVA